MLSLDRDKVEKPSECTPTKFLYVPVCLASYICSYFVVESFVVMTCEVQ